MIFSPEMFVCAINDCTEDYVGKTARGIVESAKDHNGRDPRSHLVKYVIENNHLPSVNADFSILDSGYRNKNRKRKIAEELMIKVIRPSLNSKEKSVELKLFNSTLTLHTNIYSRSILETLHWLWDLSKFDNSDTTVCSSEKLVCSCYINVIFNFYYFIVVPIGETCSKSLMRFNNCIFNMFFYFITDCEEVFHNVLKF